MGTACHVSDERFAQLPEPLRRAATWASREELKAIAAADRAAIARWPDPARQSFVRDVEEFVAKELLLQEQLAHAHVGEDDAAPIELGHETQGFALRGRRFDLAVSFVDVHPLGPEVVEGAAAQARRVLAVPPTDAATGRRLRRAGWNAFADGAWIELRCPKAGGFLGGMCPRLWVYAEARTVVWSKNLSATRRSHDILRRLKNSHAGKNEEAWTGGACWRTSRGPSIKSCCSATSTSPRRTGSSAGR